MEDRKRSAHRIGAQVTEALAQSPEVDRPELRKGKAAGIGEILASVDATGENA